MIIEENQKVQKNASYWKPTKNLTKNESDIPNICFGFKCSPNKLKWLNETFESRAIENWISNNFSQKMASIWIN